jgi:hypothetical protein
MARHPYGTLDSHLRETFRITPMDDEQDRLGIEEFAELVCLSIPQTGAPMPSAAETRCGSAESGYRNGLHERESTDGTSHLLRRLFQSCRWLLPVGLAPVRESRRELRPSAWS